MQTRVETKQFRQKLDHDKAGQMQFSEGEKIYARNFDRNDPLAARTNHYQRGPVSFDVQLQDGPRTRRHQDQLRRRSDAKAQQNKKAAEENNGPAQREDPTVLDGEEAGAIEDPMEDIRPPFPEARRYPVRERRPPERLVESLGPN